jgi:hypothetical protein
VKILLKFLKMKQVGIDGKEFHQMKKEAEFKHQQLL